MGLLRGCAPDKVVRERFLTDVAAVRGDHLVDAGIAGVIGSYPVRDVETGVAPHVLDLMDELAGPALQFEVGGELRRDRGGIALFGYDRVPLLVGGAHDDLVRLQRVVAKGDLLVCRHFAKYLGRLGLRDRPGDPANVSFVLRPEQLEVRLDLEVGDGRDVVEYADLFGVQLVPDLRRDLFQELSLGVRPQLERYACHRLTHLDPGLAASRSPQAGKSHRKPGRVVKPRVDQRLVRDRPVLQMDALPLAVPADVLVDLLRHERNERRHELDERRQALVESRECSHLVGVDLRLPEASPAPPHVPVGQPLDEFVYLPDSSLGIVSVERRSRRPYKLVQLRDDPTVEFRALSHGRRRCFGRVPVDVGVRREERVDVPQGDEHPPARLVRPPEAEEQVGRRIGAAVHPAHGVHAHLVGALLELDGIALALVHLIALFIHERCVGEVCTEGLRVLKRSAHSQERVEPVAELPREALRDEVCREPLLPVVLVVSIAQCGEGDDAGIEPGVAHVLDPRGGHPALLARYLHLVDPRAMRRVALEPLPALDGALLQLNLAADDLEVPAVVALIYR